MSLVPYSSSEDESDDALPSSPPFKKRKVSPSEGTKSQTDLPPLPTSFLDQYSSTVRASAQDDPSLHGGRKRVTPHVQGKWPTHVYLEWHPGREEAGVLSEIVTAAQKSGRVNENIKSSTKEDDSNKGHLRTQHSAQQEIHSLLQNDLGVSLPLHISLSRPLALKTAQKDPFLHQLQQQIAQESAIKAFDVKPKDVYWHPNETGTRWFLVLRFDSTRCEAARKGLDVLERLLRTCNGVSRAFGQPELYTQTVSGLSPKSQLGKVPEDSDHFHISLAWSLQTPGSTKDKGGGAPASTGRSTLSGGEKALVSDDMTVKLTQLSIRFFELKVRIGQDVHRIPLKVNR